MKKSNRPAKSKRRGILSMELVMTLPILGVLMLGIFEFSMLFYGRELVVEAARIGARKAMLPGVTLEDVQTEVRRVLPPRMHTNMKIEADLGAKTGDVVAVGVSVPATNVTPDFLWMIGISMQNQNIYAETAMVRE